jgi:hypothetical protein
MEGGGDRQSKLKELLERRKAAARQRELDALAGNRNEGNVQETEVETRPPGGQEQIPKGMGRAEFLAKLRNSRGKVGVSSQGSSEDTPKPTSRAEMLARLRAKTQAKDQVAQESCVGDASDGKSSGVSHNTDDIEDLTRLMEQAKIPHSLNQEQRTKGVKGREFLASANIVRVNLIKEMGVFEYSCKFEPAIDSIKDKKHLIRQLTDTIGQQGRSMEQRCVSPSCYLQLSSSSKLRVYQAIL